MAAPVEKKVQAASWTALVAAFVVGWLVQEVPFLSGASEPLQAAVVGALTAVAAGVAGWVAKHTPRPAGNDQTAYPSQRR